MADLSSSGLADTISESDYNRFCEYFYRRTGISFGDNKRYFVDKRILERIRKTNTGSFRAYFEMIRLDTARAEIEQLINLFTVNETYFYREDHQFDCLRNSILPEMTVSKRKGDRVRIWSMPCSTGEEPYSIALQLLEGWSAVDDYEIEIIGSDIDTDVLRAAEAGIYDQRALHRLSRTLVNRYFEPYGENRFRIAKAIRDSVQFTRVNLSNIEEMRRHCGFDVIFCRNVLIYFDDVSRRQAADCFYDCLSPGGFICLGHSESMGRISAAFNVRKFPDAIVYQKPGALR